MARVRIVFCAKPSKAGNFRPVENTGTCVGEDKKLLQLYKKTGVSVVLLLAPKNAGKWQLANKCVLGIFLNYTSNTYAQRGMQDGRGPCDRAMRWIAPGH